MLESSFDWAREEFLLYLLHCRGYNPKNAGSHFGEKGARERVGLKRLAWTTATECLEGRGLIVTVPNGKHPLTLIASAMHPFLEAFRPSLMECRLHDGHRWETLMSSNVDVIKMPWRVMDEDRLYPEKRLAAIGSLNGLRLLTWSYGEARSDGWIPSNVLWLESDDPVTGKACSLVAERLKIPVNEIDDAMQELLRLGLLEHTEIDGKGRGVIQLGYPLEPVSPSTPIRTEEPMN